MKLSEFSGYFSPFLEITVFECLRLEKANLKRFAFEMNALVKTVLIKTGFGVVK